ncbi:MAG: TIGR03960 family B12-binding radical SAM protein [Armatimonadota bacterium]
MPAQSRWPAGWQTVLEQKLLRKVDKPARYSGGEWNIVVKDWDRTDLKFVVLYPDTYELGMSNLAIQIVYDMVNRRDDALCERAFCPWVDMEALMREHQVPLYGLESRHPLNEFDVVGFSLGYEQTYTNILTVLDLGGIPLTTDARGDDDPIVLAGGNCVFNPEPVADFIDCFLIGECEEVLTEFLDTVKATRGLPRAERLKQIAQIPGIYVPIMYRPVYGEDGALQATLPVSPEIPGKVSKRVIQDLDSVPYPTKPVVSYMQAVHDRITLEMFRGCTRGCRFCQAGMITRPVRERSQEKLVQLARELVENTGCDEISLMSLSTLDHTKLPEVIDDLQADHSADRISLSLSSLRVDAFSVEIADKVQEVRKSGLTFAPEAGSQRMRDVVSKTVSEEDMFTAAESAFRRGWKKIKIYTMIGLPTETDEDVLATAALAIKVLEIGRKVGVRAEVHCGVSTFVPKAHTPFQWHGQDTLEEIRRKQQILRDAVRPHRGIKLSLHDAATSFCEGLLSRADRRVGRVILRVWQEGGRFDGWDEMHDPELWARCCEAEGIDPHWYANRHRPYEEALPWDHIDCGVTKRFLMVEDRKARKPVPRIVEDCKTTQCFGCAACWDLNVDIWRATGEIGGDAKGEKVFLPVLAG